MPEYVIPCYGGPYDGKFYGMNRSPIGYKPFDVRDKKVYLWKSIKVERLDFDTLEKASMLEPEDHPQEEG